VQLRLNLAPCSQLKSWNNLPDNTITIGKSLIVAKDEIAINTDKATVNTFKTKHLLRKLLQNIL
jgi:membrane-bound lytic murein transglycosylase D